MGVETEEVEAEVRVEMVAGGSDKKVDLAQTLALRPSPSPSPRT